MVSMDRIFNVKPSQCDKRDLVYTSAYKQNRSIDLRSFDSPIEDQGALGSCAAHAVTSVYENQLNYLYPAKFKELSRLFLYYHTRVIENTKVDDAGVIYLRSMLKAGNKYGLCSEDLWNYTISDFNKQPTPDSYADSCSRKILNYRTTPTISSMERALMMNKPIVIGFEVFESFGDVTKENPIVPIPPVTASSTGGHAVTVVGYSTDDQYFIIKNSFGTDWGDEGYAYMPYEFVQLYAYDKWTFDISDNLVSLYAAETIKRSHSVDPSDFKYVPLQACA